MKDIQEYLIILCNSNVQSLPNQQNVNPFNEQQRDNIDFHKWVFV